MIISKNPDGTSSYSGAAIPIVVTLAQILDLKYITFNTSIITVLC